MTAPPRVFTMFPPNYKAINAAFNVRGKPVIFAFNGAIYNPARIDIPQHLIEHEKVHLYRQACKAEVWWERYIADKQFRLAEEIPAHAAEYRFMRYRADADACLGRIAGRLASPLYGSMVKAEEARRLIVDMATEIEPATGQ